MGWYDGNSGSKTHRACEKERNAYGLFDMSGNVCEWTSTKDGTNRVYRGGSWISAPQNARVAYSSGNTPDYRYGNLGVRLA